MKTRLALPSARQSLPTVVDVGLTLVFVTVGQLDVWSGLEDGGPAGTIRTDRPLNAALSLIGLSMVVLRRRAPLAGLALMLATGAIQVHFVQPVALFFGEFVPVVFMTYAVAAFSRGLRPAVAGLAVACGGMAFIMLSVPSLRSWNEAVFDNVVLGTAWFVGYLVGARGQRAEALAERAEQLEHERERAVADERARLARELHDIVAHSVSVIAVQAQAGEALLDEPARAGEAFRSIQATSRQALVELRRLLCLLRQVDGLPTLTPQPGLAQLDALVEMVRSAGLTVDFAVEGSPEQVDPGVDLSAYRIVQEALTNALKHGGPTTAMVRVRYLADAVELEVVDDGGPGSTGTRSGSGSGHGLVGMRERVNLYHGQLTALRRPEGGFLVRARLPLEPA